MMIEERKQWNPLILKEVFKSSIGEAFFIFAPTIISDKGRNSLQQILHTQKNKIYHSALQLHDMLHYIEIRSQSHEHFMRVNAKTHRSGVLKVSDTDHRFRNFLPNMSPKVGIIGSWCFKRSCANKSHQASSDALSYERPIRNVWQLQHEIWPWFKARYVRCDNNGKCLRDCVLPSHWWCVAILYCI